MDGKLRKVGRSGLGGLGKKKMSLGRREWSSDGRKRERGSVEAKFLDLEQ